MPKSKSMMQSVIDQLEKERTRLEDELRRVSAALAAFGQTYMQGVGSRPRRKRTISAAGRRRIAAAQKKRWARVRAGKQSA
jgi:hypothetical protein